MTDTESETWAAVPGYEGLYEVSDQGRVRSLSRTARVTTPEGKNASRPVERKILTLDGSNTDQGRVVGLYRGGIERRLSVARLVLLAHGPEPETPTMQAKRIDPNGDLCLENLEWRRPITKNKLTEKEAATIYKWAWETSMTDVAIGRHFEVSRETVSHIKHGYNWNHVTDNITVDKS